MPALNLLIFCEQTLFPEERIHEARFFSAVVAVAIAVGAITASAISADAAGRPMKQNVTRVQGGQGVESQENERTGLGKAVGTGSRRCQRLTVNRRLGL
jgi:hypothetical protein